MKQYSKKLFSLVVLFSATTVMLHADNDNNNGSCNRVVPYYQWRSQGRDMARKLYGTTSYAVYQGDKDCCYGTFNTTVQYDQTFRGGELAECIFGPAIVSGDNSCDVITISGLGTAGNDTSRGARELMAENFLLPRDFKSTISFSPKIQDVVVDFNLFVGLDRWVNGLYFRLYGPVVWNRATLKPEENIVQAGTETTDAALGGGYPLGYFDPAASVPTQSLFANALSFFGGCEFPRASYDDSSVSVEPLKFAKFSNCNLNSTNSCDDDCNSFRRHKTGFAELRGEFGYNYIQEKYRLLLNIQAAAPTGSKVKAEYLFPAYIGNGHHWELGVGVGGAWKMWQSEDMEKSFNFIVEADITHLFNAKQQLAFDLKCKPLSRYMLAEKLITQTDTAEQLTAPAGTAQFDVAGGEYAPVANFSTRYAKVSFGVQGDLVAMFNYTCRGFSWDLGYNFWALSSSKIKLSDDCDDSCGTTPFPANTWALKGDASVAGYATVGEDTFTFGLGATESGSTIFTGTNVTGANPYANPNIDPTVTAAVGNVNGTTPTALHTGINAANAINSSSNPVFISVDDLDVEGAEQRGLSNKVFTHFSYTWNDCCDRWTPYLGAGFSAEFGSHCSEDCGTSTIECDECPSSVSCALTKWAVEVKGGVSFH